MTELNEPISPLALYQTKAIVPLQTFGPGVYTQKLLSQGNSILSSLFVSAIDAGTTVDVTYFDYGLGSAFGEKYYHSPHTQISAPTIPAPDRILITKIHDKPVCQITVTGGSANLGVYITVVASFASDLDSALIKDTQVANLISDKGIPVITYDQNQNKFFILRSENGYLPISISEAGTGDYLSATTQTTPGAAQTLIDDLVPAGKTRKITQSTVVSRTYGKYIVTVNGAIIGSGRTGPEKTKDVFTWNPRYTAVAGDEVKLIFTAHSDSPINDVEAYIMSSDI